MTLYLYPISYIPDPDLHPNLPTWLSGLTLDLPHLYGLAGCLLGSWLILVTITGPDPDPDLLTWFSGNLSGRLLPLPAV